MAYPKYYSSLALVAFVLIAAASFANCQLPSSLLGNHLLPLIGSSDATVLGIVTCTISPPPRQQLVGVIVFLSCDGGRTAIAPPAQADGLGLFIITVTSPNAALVNTDRCAVFVTTNVSGCPTLRPGEVFRAPLIELNRNVPVFAILRIFPASLFSVGRIA